MVLPRRAIVRISFEELGRMVSLAQWENQALLGYIKKYVLPSPCYYRYLAPPSN